MVFQLPLIIPTGSELLVHSESLPVYKARADTSNRTSASGSSHGPKDRKPVVAEIKSWTGLSGAIQVNDEPPSKPVAGRKGKASKSTSGSKFRAAKTSYPAKELTTAAVVERSHTIYGAEGGIQPPTLGVTRQSSPGNQNDPVSSNQIDLKQERIFLYEAEDKAYVPTVVYTDGATIVKTETRRDTSTEKHDVIISVASSSIDAVSAVNNSSIGPADVARKNQPELVTSSNSTHRTFTDVIDPAVEKTQPSRGANTRSPNPTESSSNNSARTEYEFASFSVGDEAANLTRPSPEMRGEISGGAPGMSRGDVAALSAGCALCLCVVLLLVAAFRYRKRSKEKRKKPVLDDIVNPSLLEDIIRVELARGRVKMYRTAITDTRELERLPLGGGGPANDQWGTPTIPAKLHGEIPGASTARHSSSYRPLFSDSPVRIYDLFQAKWNSADPDLVNVLRPWNTSYGDGCRQSPVRSENPPLKTMSFPGGSALPALPVDSTQATHDSHVTRSNAPCSDALTHFDFKPQSVTGPCAPTEASHTTVSGEARCTRDSATVDTHHRKRFPKMGQSCLLNRRSNCSTTVSTNTNAPLRNSFISTVMSSNAVVDPIHPQTISHPGSSALSETESKRQNAGSLFVAKGNALPIRQTGEVEFSNNEILWRNDTKRMSHLRSSPIYVNTHLPTILSRDTAV